MVCCDANAKTEIKRKENAWWRRCVSKRRDEAEEVIAVAVATPTLRDAVHDLSRDFEAGGEACRKRGGEVDGHGARNNNSHLKHFFESQVTIEQR